MSLDSLKNPKMEWADPYIDLMDELDFLPEPGWSYSMQAGVAPFYKRLPAREYDAVMMGVTIYRNKVSLSMGAYGRSDSGLDNVDFKILHGQTRPEVLRREIEGMLQASRDRNVDNMRRNGPVASELMKIARELMAATKRMRVIVRLDGRIRERSLDVPTTIVQDSVRLNEFAMEFFHNEGIRNVVIESDSWEKAEELKSVTK